MSSRKAAIRAITSYLPPATLTNDQLAAEFGGDWTAEKILTKTGIDVRHVCTAEECASDLGVAAAKKLFSSGACSPEDIDFLLFCTQSPDYFLPTTACLAQARLGLRVDSGAIDINQGCSGFVYGLAMAKSLVESGTANNVLLITAETYSKFINHKDRSVRAIFGDAGAATLVVGVEGSRDFIGPFVFGTDGRGAKELIVPAGAARKPPSSMTAIVKEVESGNSRSEQNLYMNGPEIFAFTLRVVPSMVGDLLKKSRLGFEEVDRFVFHQANKFMLDHLQAKLKIPDAKFSMHLRSCGNTVSCTIPLALESDREAGRLASSNRVMLVGFGVGLSWAATMVEIL